MKPAAVATYLADHAEAMKYVGEEVAVTRAGATAALTISSIAQDGNGMLSINVTPIGLEPQAGYAFALDIETDGSSYHTTYTPTCLMVDSDRIAIGVNGLYASMGTITVGKYMQLFVV